MRRSFKIAAAGLAAIAVLGGGGYAGFWYLAAGAAESAIEDWVAARQADGFEASIDHIAVSGFPGNILIKIDGLLLAPNNLSSWRWTTETIEASIDPKNLRRIVMRFPGAQTLGYPYYDEYNLTEIRAQRLTVQLDLNNDQAMESLSIDAAGLSLDASVSPDDPVTAGRFQFRASFGPGPGVAPDGTQISVRFDKLVMPAHTRGPLGNTVDLLQANLELRGAIESVDLVGALPQWRDARGAVLIREAQVRWGTLDLSGRGGFNLDDQLRPQGSIDAQIRGYVTTIEAFHAAGLLDDEERKSIDSVINFLAQRGPSTNIGLPVRAGDGLIFVGPVSLGKIGPLIPPNQAAD